MNESITACWTMLLVTSMRGTMGTGETDSTLIFVYLDVADLVGRVEHQMLDDRAQCKRRDERQGTDDDDCSDQHRYE